MRVGEHILRFLLEANDPSEDFDPKELHSGPMEFMLRWGFLDNWSRTAVASAVYRDGKIEYQNENRGQWWPVEWIRMNGKVYHGTPRGRSRFESAALARAPGQDDLAAFKIKGGIDLIYWTVIPVPAETRF